MLTFETLAPALRVNGFVPIPIRPRSKRPSITAWTKYLDRPPEQDLFQCWLQQYCGHGVGIVCGEVIGIDIDIYDDPEFANHVDQLAMDHLGEAPLRIGRWPKRLRVYRTENRIGKMREGPVEILAVGQQFVASGIHPDTGDPYSWPRVDISQLRVRELREVTESQVRAFLVAVRGLLPDRGPRRSGARHRPTSQIVLSPHGLVIDGRDEHLSRLAFHAVRDALEAELSLDPENLSSMVWQRFADSTDLARPRKDQGCAYSREDAREKVADKLRLYQRGSLPERTRWKSVRATIAEPLVPVDTARDQTRAALSDLVDEALRWQVKGAEADERPIGAIRVSTGVGKSVIARSEALRFVKEAKRCGLKAHRVAFLVPTHRLAAEAAEATRELGLRVHVWRGREAINPDTGSIMCAWVERVRDAEVAGEPIQSTACVNRFGTKFCSKFDECAYQAQKLQAEKSDVVFASNSLLFSVPSRGFSNLGLVVIDEAFWQSGVRLKQVPLESLSPHHIRDRGLPSRFRRPNERQNTLAFSQEDLRDLRAMLYQPLAMQAPGHVCAETFHSSGLTSDDCETAIALEERRLNPTGMNPWMSDDEWSGAVEVGRTNKSIKDEIAVWKLVADLLQPNDRQVSAILEKVAASKKGNPFPTLLFHERREIGPVWRIPTIVMDATLPEDVIRCFLPRCVLAADIDVAMPNTRILQVADRSFGKSVINIRKGMSDKDRKFRDNLQKNLVDHINLRAKECFPGEVVVITNLETETSLSALPVGSNVLFTHFNAIGGLDRYRQAACIIIIGRPLPRPSVVENIAKALFNRFPELSTDGWYESQAQVVSLRNGKGIELLSSAHPDPDVEKILRAITDVELIQSVGRGRGVNRGESDPLQVDILTNVALPMVIDEVCRWKDVRPRATHQMALRGVILNSPADAFKAYPDLFSSPDAARKALDRSGISRTFPNKVKYVGNCPLNRVTYRPRGRGQQTREALFDPRQVKDIAVWLAQFLGPLAQCWVHDPE